jgi:hypothetical protein
MEAGHGERRPTRWPDPCGFETFVIWQLFVLIPSSYLDIPSITTYACLCQAALSLICLSTSTLKLQSGPRELASSWSELGELFVKVVTQLRWYD